MSGTAKGQTFSTGDEATRSERRLYFIVKEAPKVQFTFVPPAKKMFLDAAGAVRLFPSLFPHPVFFRKLEHAPQFAVKGYNGPVAAYEIQGRIFALDANYKLFSATIRADKLFILAQDVDGDFVQLDASHFAVYLEDGRLQPVEEIKNDRRSISLLVDRSSSMTGFDEDMDAAIRVLSSTIVHSDYCALYEFGGAVRVIQTPMHRLCADVVPSYIMTGPDGGTPLYSAMEQAYRDLQATDTVAAVVILSDGAPTDYPSPSLIYLSRSIPTFVLWVGDHTANYIASYSTAHAVSRTGVESEVADFLRGVSFSVRGHQAFRLLSPNRP